ncbi:UNVERIFIED_CONTAM: hypothetical protein Scaly_2852000 [Sesamum calycinum]|uniref:Uncharacterized protein n=1 Tax=Sesamum calycinum TaxID=2727403 RepID=A0AAW2LFX2_9LAMI
MAVLMTRHDLVQLEEVLEERRREIHTVGWGNLIEIGLTSEPPQHTDSEHTDDSPTEPRGGFGYLSEELNTRTEPIEAVFSTIAWCCACVLAVYAVSRGAEKLPLVLVLWWGFSSMCDLLVVVFYILHRFKDQYNCFLHWSTVNYELCRFFITEINLKWHHVMVLALVFFTVKTVESLSQRQRYFGARRIGTRVRAAWMALIYKKPLSVKEKG